MDRTSDTGHGVVTFLDVLGWRGVYNRKLDAVDQLFDIVGRITELVKSLGMLSTRVVSISDTIAAFSVAEDDEVEGTIERHGDMARQVVALSIEREIPLRGATSVGEFELRVGAERNIFLGRAVDEVAAWYEQGDWIGVHLTPSALMSLHGTSPDYWRAYELPTKGLPRWETLCARWDVRWNEGGGDRRALEEHFRNMGPLTPDISRKYVNTLAFYDRMAALERGSGG